MKIGTVTLGIPMLKGRLEYLNKLEVKTEEQEDEIAYIEWKLEEWEERKAENRKRVAYLEAYPKERGVGE